MKAIKLILIYIFIGFNLNCAVYKVGIGGEFATLAQVSSALQPGDTILLMPGAQTTNQYISNLKGAPGNWIYMISNPQNPAVFSGGSTAFQLTDAQYLHISGIVFENQSANAVNLDDGGTYDSPSKHIIIENCHWKKMNATGNNDQLKMSGIDSFIVRNNRFENGSTGGSMIDMVGCHYGLSELNKFENAGSNAIQAKGGTSDINISRNHFKNAGQRSINIGGSTGLEFFRPIDAKYEAARIFVYSNIIEGAVASLAFVGSRDCEVINNTLVNPSRWLVRILQENTNQGFLPCGNNKFINNICYFSNAANNEGGINIGGNTAPETFEFSNNLWFNSDNSNWNGPNTIITHLNTVRNQDPLFQSGSDYIPASASPVKSRGKIVSMPVNDYSGLKFANPPSIGAYEIDISSGTGDNFENDFDLQVFPNPAQDYITISMGDDKPFVNSIKISNSNGIEVRGLMINELAPIRINVSDLQPGIYFIPIDKKIYKFVKM